MTRRRPLASTRVLPPGPVVVPFPARVYNGSVMQPVQAPAPRPQGPFRIGEWQVYPDRNLLVGPGATRRLEGQVMELLVLLASRAGDVISKEAITDTVWEGRLIAEGTITNAVAELRQALGDSARSPRFIETIPKRGYRLVVAAEPLPPPAAEAVVPRSPRTRVVLLVAAATLGAVAGLTTWLLTRSRPPDPGSVLVMPFVNRTGDSVFDPLALLARDHLVSRLSESGVARAVPGPSESPVDDLARVSTAARRVGAGLAITGDLYLQNGGVEVQARLVDTSRGALLYAVPSARAPRDNAASALEEAESRVLGALASHLTAHAHASLLSRPPRFEAYREFIAGSELYATDLLAAVEHLARAVEVDPEYTSAQIRLAMALRGVGRVDEGRAVLDRLGERRGQLNEFEWLWLDWALASFDGRWEDALTALRRIQRHIPGDPVLRLLVGGGALAANQPREAATALEILVNTSLPTFFDRHPMFVNGYRYLATARHMAGDPAGALEAARTGLAKYHTDHELLVAEAKALAALGDETDLDAVVATALATPSRTTPASLLVEAAASARAFGRPALANRLARRAEALLETDEASGDTRLRALLLAEARVLVGDLDRAQETLAPLLSSLPSDPSPVEVASLGWLGAVAARRGEVATARAVEAQLAAVQRSRFPGAPTHYRAAIAAWLGERERAVQLLQRAQAEGWGRHRVLHDEERVLFEPLEGIPEYEAILHPEG